MSSITNLTQYLTIIALASCGFILIFSLVKYKKMRMNRFQKWIVVIYIGHIICVSAYLCAFFITNTSTIHLVIWTVLFASYLMNHTTKLYVMLHGSLFGSSTKKLLLYTLVIIIISSLWPIGYYLQSLFIFIVLLSIVFLYDAFRLHKFVKILKYLKYQLRGGRGAYAFKKISLVMEKEYSLEQKELMTHGYIREQCADFMELNIPKSIIKLIYSQFLYITYIEEETETAPESKINSIFKKMFVLWVAGAIFVYIACVAYCMLLIGNWNKNNSLESVGILIPICLIIETWCLFLQQKVSATIYTKLCRCCPGGKLSNRTDSF